MFFIACVLLLALPWLNPFSLGPTPAVPTLLFSWGCGAVFLLIFCAIPSRTRSDQFVRIVVSAWLVAALTSALIGMLQYFGKSDGLGIWINVTSVGEAFGNLRQRNHFATLTSIGLAAVIFCGAHIGSRVQSEPHSFQNRVCGTALILAAALLAAANAASSSRTGLMQLVLLVVMAGVWRFGADAAAGIRSKWVRNVVVAASVSYLLAAFSFPLLASLDPEASGILARLHENSAACSGRTVLWSNVLHLIALKPWFGWGWGELGYAHFITLYPGARFCDILDNAHNLPLHLAVELGVPFAAIFCGLCFWLIWRTRFWSEASSTRQLAWMVLAAVALHSLLEYPLWYGPFQMAVALSVWLLWRTPAVSARKSQWAAATDLSYAQYLPSHQPAAILGVFVLAVCSYVGWDYWRISQIYTTPAERAQAYQADTLEKVRASWVFRNQVRFAELGITPLTQQGAEHTLTLAIDLLHFSAEPQVVQKIVDSASLLKRDADVQFYAQRFRAAFPQAYDEWRSSSSQQLKP